MFRISEIFKTQHIDEFSTGLAGDLNRRFPPSSEARTDTGAVNQLKIILEGLGVRAGRFQEQHHLGIYGKAKLANVFKWKLKELGYSEVFIENATKLIVARISARKTEPAK
jgi:hypothetical protein